MLESAKNKLILVNQTHVAKALGVRSQTVNGWFNHSGVPADRIIPLCEFLDWEVTPHEIDPIVYPNPNDALPNNINS